MPKCKNIQKLTIYGIFRNGGLKLLSLDEIDAVEFRRQILPKPQQGRLFPEDRNNWCDHETQGTPYRDLVRAISFLHGDQVRHGKPLAKMPSPQ